MIGRDGAGQCRRTQGFTLVELLIALVIVSILAAVAIPAYSAKVRQGRQVDAQRILMSVAQTEEIYRFQNGIYTNVVANLTNLGWANDSVNYPNPTIVLGNAGATFVATATANIGGAVADIWTIDNFGTLTNTQNGSK